MSKANKYQLAEAGNRVPKILLLGPEGSGKTRAAIKLMTGLLGKGKPFIVRDTENSRSSVYADTNEFFIDAKAPEANKPEDYTGDMAAYLADGMKGVILDGISPAWAYLQERQSKMQGNSFQNWGIVKGLMQQVYTAIMHYSIPLIVTARVKTAYAIEENNGKQVYKKIGLAPEAEGTLAYEFDLSFMIDQNTHRATVEKDGMNGKVAEYVAAQGGSVLIDEAFGEFLRKVFKREV